MREKNIAPTQSSKRRRLFAPAAAAACIIAIVCLGVLVARKPGFLGTVLHWPRSAVVHPGPGTGKNTTQPGRLPIESAIRKRLAELEVRPGDIVAQVSQQDRSLSLKVAVPKGKPFEWIVRQLSTAAEGTPYRVSDCVVDEKKSSCTITFFSPAKRDPAVTLAVSTAEKYLTGTADMALVVEDLEDTAYQIAVSVLSFSEPLTISLAPAGKKASLIAQLAEQYKKEVVVRLPLEPPGKVPAEFQKSVIMIHYPEHTIRGLVGDAARRFPDVKGFSNLWSSRALDDTRVMTFVLDEARNRGAYFVETSPAKSSVADAVAQRLGVPYEGLLLRLEKTAAPDIVAEIKRQSAAAQARGSLVLRCAGSRALADALKAALPYLRQNGIRLVRASEIVK